MARAGESMDNYPRVVIDFGDGCRVIECGGGIQWIVQWRVHGDRHPWRGRYYCRTREALLLYSGHGDHPVLRALPERYPEVSSGPCSAENDLAVEGLPHQPVPPKSDVGGPRAALPGIPEEGDWASFNRLWRGDGVLSDWRPSGKPADLPELPELLRRQA